MLACLLSPVFGQASSRRAAFDYVRGLLRVTERRSCWQLAELARHLSPRRLQALLSEYQWSAETLVARVRELVVAMLGDPDAVLALDETAEIKQRSSNATVGVARQYAGDKTARILTAAGDLVRTLEGHDDEVLSVAVARDDHMVTGCADGTTRLWTPDGDLDREFPSADAVVSVAFVGDSEDILIVSASGDVYVWSRAAGRRRVVVDRGGRCYAATGRVRRTRAPRR